MIKETNNKLLSDIRNLGKLLGQCFEKKFNTFWFFGQVNLGLHNGYSLRAVNAFQHLTTQGSTFAMTQPGFFANLGWCKETHIVPAVTIFLVSSNTTLA